MGSLVAVFIAQNPEVAKMMMERSPLKAIAEAGKISAKNPEKPETSWGPKSKSTALVPIHASRRGRRIPVPELPASAVWPNIASGAKRGRI